MKKLLLLISGIAPALLFGQVTLTSASVFPSIGDTVTFNTMNNAGTFGSPGASGANITWDFSSMTIASTADQIFVAKRSGFRNDPPNTNICEQFSGVSGNRIQYKSSTNDLYIMGTQFGFVTQVNYGDDSLLKFKYPVSYNDVHSSNYHYAITGGLNPNQRRGTYNVSVDGWGKVKLPTGEVDGVLRVRIDESFNDTTRGTASHYTSTSYEFWQKNTKSYIMSVKYEDDDGTLDTVVVYRIQGQIDTTVIEEPKSIFESQNKKALQFFPNPATNSIQVLGSNIASDAKVRITNLSGSMNEVLEFNKGIFDISEYSNGVYILTVEGEEYQPIRFIKQN